MRASIFHDKAGKGRKPAYDEGLLKSLWNWQLQSERPLNLFASRGHIYWEMVLLFSFRRKLNRRQPAFMYIDSCRRFSFLAVCGGSRNGSSRAPSKADQTSCEFFFYWSIIASQWLLTELIRVNHLQLITFIKSPSHLSYISFLYTL